MSNVKQEGAMELEYLGLFSNTGDTTVSVRFNNTYSSITEQKLDAGEIRKLISPDGKSFITKMRFDDHLARIEKIDILLSKNRIVMHARLVC